MSNYSEEADEKKKTEVYPAQRQEKRMRKRKGGGKVTEHIKMPKVIILKRHKGMHSPVSVCVIMFLGLQPLPTVKESTREENRGCPFHLPSPTSLSDSLHINAWQFYAWLGAISHNV